MQEKLLKDANLGTVTVCRRIKCLRKANWHTSAFSLAGQELSELVAVTFLLAFSFSSLDTNFLVVLLESSQILTSLTELAFFHTLTNIPVNECTLAVHQVKLVVDAREDLCKSSSRNNGWWLVVNATLETSRRPVDELNG